MRCIPRQKQKAKRAAFVPPSLSHARHISQLGLASGQSGAGRLGKSNFSIGFSEKTVVSCGGRSFRLHPRLRLGEMTRISLVCDLQNDVLYFAVNNTLLRNNHAPRTFVAAVTRPDSCCPLYRLTTFASYLPHHGRCRRHEAGARRAGISGP